MLGVAAIIVTALTLSNTFQVSERIARGVGAKPGRILPFEPIAAEMAWRRARPALPHEPFLMRSAE